MLSICGIIAYIAVFFIQFLCSPKLTPSASHFGLLLFLFVTQGTD